MKFQVILTSPHWDLSGVNTWSVNLIRGLIYAGVPAKILLTEPFSNVSNTMPFPSDIPVDRLNIPKPSSWRTRWQAMIRYLEKQAPCIYIPNYDWWHSCVSPKLSHQIGIVGIVHSDDSVHYEHVSRLGQYWNAIVSVSDAVGQKTKKLHPKLSSRLHTISNGVPVPQVLPQRQLDSDAPLKIIYAGRLVQKQKRVFDLPEIVKILQEQQTPIKLSIVGDGADAQSLKEICQPFIEQEMVEFIGTLANHKVLEHYEKNDVFILTSDFEGMPISLLEAMSRGCVPVVTDIASGIPELVQHGVTGFRVPIGNVQQFSEHLTTLYKDGEKRQELSLNAYHKITEEGYRTQDMVEQYIGLFQGVMQDIQSGVYRRPRGKIIPPPNIKLSWKDRLPASVRTLGSYGKHMLLQLHHES